MAIRQLVILGLCLSLGILCRASLAGARPIADEDPWLPFRQTTAEDGITIAKKIHEHFPNFGMVNPSLFRGAQPELDELWRFKDAGIVSVINFRDSAKDIQKERRKCQELGLRFFSLPWSGRHRQIKEELVTEFLRIISDPENLPAFVHCKRGAERTGTLVAIYRIKFHGWTAEQAYIEMRAYDFRNIFFGHLKRYVFGYEDRLREG